LGHAIFLRSNAGLELWFAYHEDSQPTNDHDKMYFSHPAASVSESERVARIGEVAYNQEKSIQAVRWMAKHPQRTLELFIYHTVYFWFFPEQNRAHLIAMAGFTVLSFAGWLTLRKDNRMAAVLIGCIWLWFPLTYYIVFWSSRYRYPMEWTLLLTSAVLITRLPTYAFSRRKPVLAARAASSSN
jgi:hypothetical protein